MRRKVQLYFYVCFLFTTSFFSQNSQAVDSIIKSINGLQISDSIKVNKFIKLAYGLSNYEFKVSVAYSNEALKISKQNNYVKGVISAYNGLADAYWYHSDYDKAQQYYFKAYRISDSIHDQKGIAYSLYNIGWILCNQQLNFNEDKYLYRSLAIYQKLNEPAGLLKIYNAMGSYFSIKFEKTNEQCFSDSSILYFNKAIEMTKKTNTTSDLGRIYGNLGDLFHQKKDYLSANFYNEKSIVMHYKVQDTMSVMYCKVVMGLCDLETGKYKEAIKSLNTLMISLLATIYLITGKWL